MEDDSVEASSTKTREWQLANKTSPAEEKKSSRVGLRGLKFRIWNLRTVAKIGVDCEYPIGVIYTSIERQTLWGQKKSVLNLIPVSPNVYFILLYDVDSSQMTGTKEPQLTRVII